MSGFPVPPSTKPDSSVSRPMCSLFLETPFTPSGLARNLNLNPFDYNDVHRQAESLITNCLAPPKTTGALQPETIVVPCEECMHGYTNSRSTLTCRKSPICTSNSECTTCQLSAMHPYTTVPCDVCITSNCGINGRCQCVW